jgi:hypothetical protein
VWVFSAFNSTQKDMVSKEQALSAQYADNQNELSSYISTIKETLGLADRNTDALDRVLADAVKGRYEGDTSAQPGGGQLFSAITEAYPDLAGVTDAYAKVQDAVSAGRLAYKNQQTKLLDMLRDYETWKNSGFLHSMITGMVGAPSDNLRASVGDDTARGQQALDRMYKIVLTAEGNKAYESGEMEPMDLNPADPEPTTVVPAPSEPAASAPTVSTPVEPAQ